MQKLKYNTKKKSELFSNEIKQCIETKKTKCFFAQGIKTNAADVLAS